MFASFHAAPQARIGGCLLEERGERLERRKGEGLGWWWWEGAVGEGRVGVDG